MPSISKEALDALNAELAEQRELLQSARSYGDRQEARIVQFDRILDDIVSAAQGMPLGRRDDRNAMALGSYPGSYGYEPQRCIHDYPSETERLEAQLRDCRAQLLGQERHLAAVVAVAIFAKEHKA
jgi:hypothetical protein